MPTPVWQIYELEYPPAKISSNGVPILSSGAWSSDKINIWNATLAGQAYGNGVYTVQASSGFTEEYHPWLAFTQAPATEPGGHWKLNNYFGNGSFAPSPESRFTLDGTYYGDWLTIQLPVATTLSKVVFTARSAWKHRAPSVFRIYGSTDGVAWALLHDQTSPLVYTSFTGTVLMGGSSALYTHFGVVVSSIGAPGLILNIVAWRLFGKVIRVTDGS